MSIKLFSFAVAPTAALVLDTTNWDAQTADKSVFIKFFAPWCGHCKAMAPAWEKLMKEFEDSPTALVAKVDCTAGGKEICKDYGVTGYPTIKYGDPADLQDYAGQREYDALYSFAQENLKPLCG